MPGAFLPKEGEALGLLEAITWIRELEYNQVIFELDAKTIVEAVKANTEDVTEYGHTIESCKLLLQLEPNFPTSFVRRHARKIVHVIARESYFYACSRI
ncbi:hypothetical protein DITRI_Ditri02bG0193500 [Diplodiscus trichospermus]